MVPTACRGIEAQRSTGPSGRDTKASLFPRVRWKELFCFSIFIREVNDFG